MLEKIRGIVLRTIRHNDRNDIVTLYTPGRGCISCLSPSGASRAAILRRARLAPLSVVETEINFRAGRSLQYLGGISSPCPWRNLYFDPLKGAMVTFLTEFLNKLLHDSGPDLLLWNYLMHALSALDPMRRGIANYHLAFMIRLMPYAGIEPDMATFRPGHYLDMRGGVFSATPPLHNDVILPEETLTVPLLQRMNFRNLHLFRLNSDERRRIFSLLLHYYTLHLPMDDVFTTPGILHEIFR